MPNLFQCGKKDDMTSDDEPMPSSFTASPYNIPLRKTGKELSIASVPFSFVCTIRYIKNIYGAKIIKKLELIGTSVDWRIKIKSFGKVLPRFNFQVVNMWFARALSEVSQFQT